MFLRHEFITNQNFPFLARLRRGPGPVVQFAQLLRVGIDPVPDKLGEFLFEDGYFGRTAGKVLDQPVGAVVKVDCGQGQNAQATKKVLVGGTGRHFGPYNGQSVPILFVLYGNELGFHGRTSFWVERDCERMPWCLLHTWNHNHKSEQLTSTITRLEFHDY